MKKLIIGLTGGIGSGKTQAAAYFHELGIDIIDADAISREVVAPGMPSLEAIVKKFSPAILNADQSLNREKLRTHIFEHPEDRNWLEELLHPLIRAKMIQAATNCSSPYCVMVIPLLIENLPHPFVDRILVIDCSKDMQIKRIMSRDSLTIDQAIKIIHSQVSRTDRLKHAQDIIQNDGPLAHLKAQVRALHTTYLKLCEASF